MFQLEGPVRDLRRIVGRDVVITDVVAVDGKDGPAAVSIEGLRDDDGKRVRIRLTLTNWHLLRDRIEERLHQAVQRRHRRPAAGQKEMPFGD
jgi:hypothetical protein